MGGSSPWGQNKGFRQIARLELPGAGQVVVEGNYAYVGHMQPPAGTTIVDAARPFHSQSELPSASRNHARRTWSRGT